MLRKIGESFTYKNIKMVVFSYNHKYMPVNRENSTHRCYICSLGSQGNTQFARHCGPSDDIRGECNPGRVFLTAKDFKKSTREQRSLISTNPNKFK